MKRALTIVSLLLCLSILTACGSSTTAATEGADDLSSINEKLVALEGQINSLKEENETLKNDNETLKNDNESLKNGNASLSSELEKKNNEVSSTAEKREESSSTTEVTSEAKEEVKAIKIGETVSDRSFDFTLKNVSLTYKAEPDTKPSFYTYYEAKPGKVYIKVDAVIKNTGKVGLGCDDIYTVTADYNNGYPYSGCAVADHHSVVLTFARITRIYPLETLGVHYLIECPEEVDTNTSAPLSVEIVLEDGSKYTYKIR